MKKLNVVLITQGVSRVVEPILCCNHNIVGVLESAPRGLNEAEYQSLSKRGLRNIKSLLSKKKSLKSFCVSRGVAYKLMFSSSREVEQWLIGLEVELIVIYSMSRLLKPNIISIPEYGVINLHPSVLPYYRGPNPCLWQYVDEVMEPGVTVHFIDEGEDTGDIISSGSTKIERGVRSPARLDKLIGSVGVPLLLKAIDDIALGICTRHPQPKDSPTSRARNLNKSEHSTFIQWRSWPGEKIWHVLRGTELWLDALPQPSGINIGQRWSIEDFHQVETGNSPSQLFQNEDGKMCVATRDGYISLSIRFRFLVFVKSILRISLERL